MQNSFRFPLWNHLFYFLLQGIMLILKCSRYFICSDSIKKMSIFAWYLVFVFFFSREMIPLRKSEWILHTSLLTSVILTAKPILYKYILLVRVICEKYRLRENATSLNIKHWIYRYAIETFIMRDRRGRNRMVVGFIPTYAISSYHH
jgi:hypothetical protein